MLKLHEDKLRKGLEAETFCPLDRWSTADDLDSLLADLREAPYSLMAITTDSGEGEYGESVHVYPMSISEPDPITAVQRGCLKLLGHEVKLRGDDAESDPAGYTVRIIGDIVADANAQLSTLDRQTEGDDGELHSKLRAEAEAEAEPVGIDWDRVASFLGVTVEYCGERFVVRETREEDECPEIRGDQVAWVALGDVVIATAP